MLAPRNPLACPARGPGRALSSRVARVANDGRARSSRSRGSSRPGAKQAGARGLGEAAQIPASVRSGGWVSGIWRMAPMPQSCLTPCPKRSLPALLMISIYCGSLRPFR